MCQLDMFLPVEISEMKDQLIKVKKSTEQVRKGLFARHTALEKYLTEIKDKLEQQEKEIYKLKKKLYEHGETEYYLEVVK